MLRPCTLHNNHLEGRQASPRDIVVHHDLYLRIAASKVVGESPTRFLVCPQRTCKGHPPGNALADMATRADLVLHNQLITS
jgi:hypothetical protein